MNILEFLTKHSNIFFIILCSILLIGLGFIIYWVVGNSGNIPWHKCIVPYVLNNGFTDSEKAIIKNCMNLITESSKSNVNDNGIIFIEKTNEIEFITFNKQEDSIACGDSLLAKRLGGQKINLTSYCINESTILHELLHALGFIHEHCRKDRDLYIIINYDNIFDDSVEQFDINNNVVSDKIIMATEYDYKSIMHYTSNGFSKNDKKTIEVKNQSFIIGDNTQLSIIDKKRLQMYYNLWK